MTATATALRKRGIATRRKRQALARLRAVRRAAPVLTIAEDPDRPGRLIGWLEARRP